MSACDLSILIVNYNTAHLFDELFASLERARGALTIQILVVDNASRDDSLQRLRDHYPGVEVIGSGANVGFGRANNLAIPHLRSDLVLLLNTDAFVATDTLVRTVAFMREHEDVGVLGVRLVGRDGALQPSCRYFPTPFNTFVQAAGFESWLSAVRLIDADGFAPAEVQDCDWVPGCYYLTRRAVIQRCGLFDPRFFLYFEEVDHCRAVKAAGWRVVYFPYTSVVHIGGESARSDGSLTSAGRQLSHLQAESEMLYYRKHHGLVGVLLHLVLGCVLAGIQASKAVLRQLVPGRRSTEGLSLGQALADQQRRLSTALSTRLGRQPVR